jgi:hypothetical protein
MRQFAIKLLALCLMITGINAGCPTSIAPNQSCDNTYWCTNNVNSCTAGYNCQFNAGGSLYCLSPGTGHL